MGDNEEGRYRSEHKEGIQVIKRNGITEDEEKEEREGV